VTYSSPKPLRSVISSVLDGLGIGLKLKRYKVIDLWPQIVGSQIAQVTKIDHIEGDKLYVAVATSAWRNELMFIKKDLIKKVNAALEQEVICDIIFR
jgi:predicted nucleic acid-binding Zn ribbon protein